MSDLFYRQKHINHRRRAALKRQYAAVIDLGSSKITCLIVKYDSILADPAYLIESPLETHNKFQIIGASYTRSRGIERGQVKYTAEVIRAMKRVVQAAQTEAGIVVDHAFVTLSGGTPLSYMVSGETKTNGSEIQETDVATALSALDLPEFDAEREPLYANPIMYQIDEGLSINDPRGHIGRKLTVDAHLVTLESKILHIVSACLKKCDLECVGIIHSAHASALSTLVENESRNGAIVIDIGAEMTSMAIFYKEQLIQLLTVPIGGIILQPIFQRRLIYQKMSQNGLKLFMGGRKPPILMIGKFLIWEKKQVIFTMKHGFAVERI